MPPKKTAKLPTVAKMASLMTGAVRNIWMYSAHRRAALNRTKHGKGKAALYECEECGAMGIKVEVHHDTGAEVYTAMKQAAIKLFPDPSELTVCCSECHALKHRKDT